MTNKKLTQWFTDNPVIIAPEDLLYVVDDPAGTPLSGGFQAAQLMTNRYRIVPSVASNDLIVALKHADGTTDPSPTKPLYFKIGDTLRSVTAATSITIADGTKWFNSGGAELGTKLVPYFTYGVWDSNSSVFALSISRISDGRLVSDFSATTTNEKHLFNYANFTTTDDVANIGYFEATLSLVGTGHLWTVPTFTNRNLRSEPTPESDWMTWVPTSSTSGSLTYSSVTYPLAKYKISRGKLEYEINSSGTLGGTASNRVSFTLPFNSINIALTDPPLSGLGWASDTNVLCSGFLQAGTPNILSIFKYNLGNFNNSGTCVIRSTGMYEI